MSTLTPQFVFRQCTQSGQINQHQTQQLHLSELMHGSIQLVNQSLIIIIIIIKSYYGAPQPVLRSASQHKLRLREA